MVRVEERLLMNRRVQSPATHAIQQKALAPLTHTLCGGRDALCRPGVSALIDTSWG